MKRALAIALLWGSAAQAQCEGPADCRAGRVCIAGECRTPTCSKDTDCSDGRVCESSACVWEGPSPEANAPAPAAITRAPAIVAQPQTPETEGVAPVWITGIATTAATYLTTVILTGVLGDPRVRGEAMGLAAIPVFGPIALLGKTWSVSDGLVIGGYPHGGLLGLSAALQTAGAVMTIVGFTVRIPVEPTQSGELANQRKTLTVSPTFPGGLQASLRF